MCMRIVAESTSRRVFLPTVPTLWLCCSLVRNRIFSLFSPLRRNSPNRTINFSDVFWRCQHPGKCWIVFNLRRIATTPTTKVSIGLHCSFLFVPLPPSQGSVDIIPWYLSFLWIFFVTNQDTQSIPPHQHPVQFVTRNLTKPCRAHKRNLCFCLFLNRFSSHLLTNPQYGTPWSQFRTTFQAFLGC